MNRISIASLRLLLLLLVLPFAAVSSAAARQPGLPPYKDASLSVEQRLDDLLGRMTLAEKLGQLRCTMAWHYYERRGDSLRLTDSFLRDIGEQHIGMLWATFRADPWTQKTLTTGLSPRLAARLANMMQRHAVEHTRLGIPLFLAEEAPHGHMAIGTTVFPTGLGLAATFSTELARRVGAATAREVRLQGGHISYGPVMDLTRDARWSRVEESLGEDPCLSGQMAAAVVRGTGGGRLGDPYTTIATPKHYVGYGTTLGGLNGQACPVGRHELQQQFLPPFRQVVEAGALSLMTSYNSIDGTPTTADPWLLTDVLRRQWGFRGFVVSDLYAINGLKNDHHVAASLADAAALALGAGVDADLGALAYAELDSLARHNPMLTAAIDQAVRRVLRLKLEMGLFEHPYVDEQAAAAAVRSPEHRQLALDVARASVTLLKNDRGVLPLSPRQRIALIGPNADNMYNQLGDYTAPQAPGSVKTLLDGLRQKTPYIEYVKGCAIRDTASADIDAAVDAARRADVVVVAVGGSSARDFRASYEATGAAAVQESPAPPNESPAPLSETPAPPNETPAPLNESPAPLSPSPVGGGFPAAPALPDMDCGEGYDRATLALLGRQQQLLSALAQTGKPLVVVYIEGRPLLKNWAAAHAAALLTAYYPGQEGGQAIADVLYGDCNPAGRLPVSVPRSEGQLPLYYNQPRPPRHDYMDLVATPLYAFGYGLSYTTFTYSNLSVSHQADGTVSVACDVTNSGSRDGDEVVQLYLTDEVATTVQPERQLRAFRRISIRRGDTEHVVFSLQPQDFSIVNAQGQRVVEPGLFTIMIGAASNDIRLTASIEL